MAQSLLDDLAARGLIAQSSDVDALRTHLAGASRTLYCGFDPTADSLHIGNLVPLLMLRRFQDHGHRPIALVGGATGLIGDPSFKSTERALNDEALVEGWVERIRAQVSRFIDLESNNGGLVVNNLDWTRGLETISFLRDVGKHFSVNAMIQKESVRSRLAREGDGISYTEFSYMILQSMDYMELARRYDCTLQIGGSDQWGNITSGMDLVRRTLGRETHALTVPLVTKADGGKFGKTESGTVWLDAARTSPYSFYQFWLNTADADVVPYLRYFTFLSLDRIDELAQTVRETPERREAQRALGRAVTELVHGEPGLVSAERITNALFAGGIEALEHDDLEQLRLDGISCSQIDEAAPGLLNVLADGGLAQSRSAARKLVDAGGVSVNGRTVADPTWVLDRDDALYGRYHLIRRGKKAWHLAVHPS